MNRNRKASASEVMDALIAFYGLKGDAALARKLEYTQGSAVSNMRRRNTYDLARIAEHCPEVDLTVLIREGIAREPDRLRVPIMTINTVTGEVLSPEEAAEYWRKREEQQRDERDSIDGEKEKKTT